MTRTLRRGGTLSAAAHIALLLALIVTLPRPKLPEQPVEETAVTVEFESSPASVQPTPVPTPAPAPAPTPTPEPPAPEPPRPAPPSPTPPPPPIPAPPVIAPPVSTPPIPTPPVPAPTPQPPTPVEPRPPAPAPPAPEQVAPAPMPAPPVPPTPRPQPQPAPTPPMPALPTPPAAPRPVPPNQAQPPSNSATSQPNPVRNPAPDSKSLESTLDRLRAQLASKEPPRAQSNPPRGGAPGVGNPAGVDNALLSAGVRRAIGDRLRECWTGDKNALDYDKQVVRLVILVDAGGTIRQADIAPGDLSRTGGGVARAFAERARRAALDAQCAQLPLPAALKGQNHTFEITFRP